MRDQILKLLHKIPFQPFSVDVAPDVPYSIPTPDHVLAAKNVLVIEDDAGLVAVIPYAPYTQNFFCFCIKCDLSVLFKERVTTH